MTPLRVRGYAVERLLGSGASGDVWQARAVASGARVALKRIAIRDDVQLRRAQAEAGLLAALEHPNLVRLHTVVGADDALVLVLDLADGGSLAELLSIRGRLTPGEVITAVAPVAAALDYLHGEGVVHGDVSAANLLFTTAGVALLADVGVARLSGDQADAEATPAYVDPAVAAGCVPGPQSDVFMLAGVALHALTGSPPWPDADAAAALARAAAGVLDDVAQRLATAGVPAAMARVLTRALDVDPQRRGTAADLALDLAHSGTPVAVELSAGLERAQPRLVSRPGPRHAAPPPGGRGRPAIASAGPQAAPDPARPAFERPSAPPAAAGSAPPTRMVGARARPVIPRPARRGLRPGLLAGALGVVLVGGLAAIAAAWGTSTHGTRQAVPDGSNGRPKLETSAVGTVHRPRPVHRPPRTAPPGRTLDWGDELARLDDLRARAFARRDPALLGRVYVHGRLLAADTALLARIVPPGCVLRGVHTRYSGVHAARRGPRVVVEATATLAASRLSCRGVARDAAPGVPATRLRLVLVPSDDGTRIAGERVLGPG